MLDDTLGIQFSGRTSDPSDSDLAQGRLYYNSTSGALKWYNGTSWQTVGTGGSGSVPTWESIYLNDSTFGITAGTWTISQSAAAAILTLNKTNVGAGAVIDITNSGTGADLKNSTNWSIAASGGVGILELASGGTINATGGAMTLGKSGTATTLAGTATIAEGWTVTSGNNVITSGNLTLTSGNLVLTSGTFTVSAGVSSLIATSNTAATLLVTNNTATTYGSGGTSTGVVLLRSTSLTTGTLLRLQLTEGTLNGGFYLDAWDVTGGAAVFSVAEDGVVVVGGTAAGTAAFTATVGDFVASSGHMLATDNASTATSLLAIAGSGVYTGSTTTSFVTFTPSGLTTGTGVYLPLAALTTGKGLHITSGASQTTGSLLFVQDTGANSALTSGTIASFDHTATAITGTVNKTAQGVAITSSRTTTTGTVADDWDLASVIRTSIINGAGAMTSTGSVLYVENVVTNTSGTVTDTANGIEVVMDADGTGDGVKITHNAITGKALDVVSSGTTAAGVILATANSLTSGQILKVASSATAIATTGRLFLSSHTGATGTSATLNEFITSANDETILLGLTGNSLTTGQLLVASATAQTSGTLVSITGGGANISSGIVVDIEMGAATAGTGLKVLTSGVYAGSNNMVLFSANSATTSTGVLSVSATGLTSGSAVLVTGGGANLTSSGKCVEVAMGAATDGVGLSIVTSGVYTGAGVLQITASSATTGTVAVITANGLTTGHALSLTSSGVITTTGDMLAIVASGATTSTGVVRVTTAALTTGSAILVVANALTSGSGLTITSSSADTTARGLVQLTGSSSSATGLSAIRTTMSKQSTHFCKILTDSTTGVTLWYSDGTTANGNLTAAAGDICFNAGSNKPEYNTNGVTAWTALV